MKPIEQDLDLVVGGAPPAPTARPAAPNPSSGGSNNLTDWLPRNADIKPADNRAFTNPPDRRFQSNTPIIDSPPDRSWEAMLPKAFDQFGIK